LLLQRGRGQGQGQAPPLGPRLCSTPGRSRQPSGRARAGPCGACAHSLPTPGPTSPLPTHPSGIALGLALTVYGREEGADALIEQMSREADPILRYGAMFATGLAYRGTDNNAAIQKLLHFAVTDVSDDVRRCAGGRRAQGTGLSWAGPPGRAPWRQRPAADSSSSRRATTEGHARCRHAPCQSTNRPPRAAAGPP
jgi:hypothetical protein